jgi:hypothetical protein
MTTKSPDEILEKVRTFLSIHKNLDELNEFLRSRTGIMDFFRSYHDLEEFEQFLDTHCSVDEENRELGDFQTPIHLTDRICKHLTNDGFAPDAVIEPTCGKGNFIISAIKSFPSLRYVYCVDIQRKYEWFFKLNMLKLSFEQTINAATEFHSDSIFTHQFSDRFRSFLDDHTQNLLILGNPPWVTNSELSTLDSSNLPSKTNIKGYRGIEAITGKGNFDIAEYIILQMIQRFHGQKGRIAMLCKTSVIKNIVRDTQKLYLDIHNIQSLLIDTEREFSINADAALFVADFNSVKENFCTVSSLYCPGRQTKKYGWVGSKFVSDTESYDQYKHLDGRSPLTWRQGVKHDAAKAMVLKIGAHGNLLNGFKESVDVEENLLYPYIKGSELKKTLVKNAANRVIITQTSPNEDTGYIALKFPKTWTYLTSHSKHFDKRKSAIYKGKPRFSIFGIGNYSFKPYKVAVSGFYKNPKFSLIIPINGKPAMLDDTCYYLSFKDFNSALYTWILLNTDVVRKLLSSIVFLDSKRPYTKEVLMRIDILQLAESIEFDALVNVYQEHLSSGVEYKLNERDFLRFRNSLRSADIQLTFNAVS